MRGEVEVWRGDTLLMKEPNMLVDGAGELLADIMTVSRSLSGIEDHATSSILDSSNYTIQAISFGTGSDAFKKNAHAWSQDKEDKIKNYTDVTFLAGGTGIPSYIEMYSWDSSSYIPEVGLPHYPDPVLRVLDLNTNVSASIGGIEVSSVFPGNGQLTNFIPSAIMSGMMEDTQFSSITSATVVASLLGCFVEGSSAPYSLSKKNRRHFLSGAPADYDDPFFTNSVDGSFFNEVSSMDVSGFVNMVMSSVPDATYNMSSAASGLVLSAAPTFASDGVIEYSVMIAAGDVGHANAYGGIYHLGLWSIDMKQSLLNGNTPPFEFTILNNPRKYKLFSRKGLSKNLCYIEDDGTNAGDKNYSDLLIKWRLHFL
jgi:hypothetical protein